MTEWWSIGVVGLCVVGVFPAQGRFREPLAVNLQNCNILKWAPLHRALTSHLSPITNHFSLLAFGSRTSHREGEIDLPGVFEELLLAISRYLTC